VSLGRFDCIDRLTPSDEAHEDSAFELIRDEAGVMARRRVTAIKG
jgi:hypothetical protein